MIPNRGGFRKGETAYAFDREYKGRINSLPIDGEFEYPPNTLLNLSHFASNWSIKGSVSAGGLDHFLDSPTFSIDAQIQSGIRDDDGTKTGTAHKSLSDMIGKPGAEGGAGFYYSYSDGQLLSLVVQLVNASKYEAGGKWGADLLISVVIELKEDPDDPANPPYVPPGATIDTVSGVRPWGTGNNSSSVTFAGMPVAMEVDESQTIDLEITATDFFAMENP